jgi:hypothetical protein
MRNNYIFRKKSVDIISILWKVIKLHQIHYIKVDIDS